MQPRPTGWTLVLPRGRAVMGALPREVRCGASVFGRAGQGAPQRSPFALQYIIGGLPEPLRSKPHVAQRPPRPRHRIDQRHRPRHRAGARRSRLRCRHQRLRRGGADREGAGGHRLRIRRQGALRRRRHVEARRDRGHGQKGRGRARRRRHSRQQRRHPVRLADRGLPDREVERDPRHQPLLGLPYDPRRHRPG